MRNQTTTNQIQNQTATRPIIAVLCLLLTLLLLGSGTLTAKAAINEPRITPYYANTFSAQARLELSGIQAECQATVKANKPMWLYIQMELQKEKSGIYTTVKTWTNSTSGTILTMTEVRAINILSDYRLKVTFTAGSETKVIYQYA